MNLDPKVGNTGNRRDYPTAARERPVASADEELETGEPISVEDEQLPVMKPVAKKIPALRGKFVAMPAGQSDTGETVRSGESSSPNNSGGGQMVLSSAKYLKTLPPEPTSRRGKRGSGHESEATGRSLEGRLLNGGAGGGMLAMGGAVVWFVVGLANGIFFFYPPILFVIGLIAFFKGLAGGEE